MKTIILWLCLMASLPCWAQDTLFTNSRKMIPCKIVEVTKTDILYLPKGSHHPKKINKKGVVAIRYNNNTTEYFNNSEQKALKNHDPQNKLNSLRPNVFGTGLSVMGTSPLVGYSSLTASQENKAGIAAHVFYERMFSTEHIGLLFNTFLAMNKKEYGGGVGAAYYPKNYGKFRLGLGGMFHIGKHDVLDAYTESVHQTELYKMHHSVLSSLSGMLRLQQNFSQKISICSNIRVGFVTSNSTRNIQLPEYWKPTGANLFTVFDMSIGYRL